MKLHMFLEISVTLPPPGPPFFSGVPLQASKLTESLPFPFAHPLPVVLLPPWHNFGSALVLKIESFSRRGFFWSGNSSLTFRTIHLNEVNKSMSSSQIIAIQTFFRRFPPCCLSPLLTPNYVHFFFALFENCWGQGPCTVPSDGSLCPILSLFSFFDFSASRGNFQMRHSLPSGTSLCLPFPDPPPLLSSTLFFALFPPFRRCLEIVTFVPTPPSVLESKG